MFLSHIRLPGILLAYLALISPAVTANVSRFSGGGKAVFKFRGVPVGTSFVVRDDGGNEGALPTSTWRGLPD